MVILDEIASILEAASVRNPDVLITTAFTIAQEVNTHSRTKMPMTASNYFVVTNPGASVKALGCAFAVP